jgi:hypothetical protein
MARAMSAGWRGVRPVDAVAALRKRWDNGEFLRLHATDGPWRPLSIPLRPPTARQLGDELDAVSTWLQAWQNARHFRLETATVGGRLIGANEVPVRAWVDDAASLWAILAVQEDVGRFDELRDLTRARRLGLEPWLAARPMAALSLGPVWRQLLDVVDWLEANAGPGVYLRQIDVPGVDTKFVERHRSVLGELLDVVLPAGRIDALHPRARFAQRYGLARKPSYVRLRRLDGAPLLLAGPAELGMRVADLAATPLAARWFVVVENETTYLALPPVDGVVALWGAGYATTLLRPVSWLRDRSVAYWSDIDTHGLVMLDRMRSHFPRIRSLLMDHDTLVAHEAHWDDEEVQSSEACKHLSSAEDALFRDLLENRFGNRVRLEQERVRFSRVASALHAFE